MSILQTEMLKKTAKEGWIYTGIGEMWRRRGVYYPSVQYLVHGNLTTKNRWRNLGLLVGGEEEEGRGGNEGDEEGWILHLNLNEPFKYHVSTTLSSLDLSVSVSHCQADNISNGNKIFGMIKAEL